MNDCYVTYKTVVSSINDQFKFNAIGWYRDERLSTFILPMLVFINKRLLLSGVNEVLDKIDVLEDLTKEINELIIEDKFHDILTQICIDPLVMDRAKFSLAWGTLTTTMLIKLNYNYGHLREIDIEEPECGCYRNYTGDIVELSNWRPINDGYEFGHGTVELYDRDPEFNGA